MAKNTQNTDVAATEPVREVLAEFREEVRNHPRVYSDETVAAVKTLDDALKMLTEDGHAVESISEYGSGTEIVIDKRTLIGKPFAIVEWRFHEGTFGGFVSALLVTERGEKLVLNDGSAGIYRQLVGVTAARTDRGVVAPQVGLLCKKGLRVSEYEYDNGNGKMTPASTFYLA